MKINNIQSTFVIKQRGNILNPAKIQEVKYDVLDISFKGKRVKHSKDFLEITKTNKDLRSFITQACLLDKDGK